MKQQLSLTQTSNECVKRELQEKTEHAVIMEKKLQLTQDQLATSQDEVCYCYYYYYYYYCYCLLVLLLFS